MLLKHQSLQNLVWSHVRKAAQGPVFYIEEVIDFSQEIISFLHMLWNDYVAFEITSIWKCTLQIKLIRILIWVLDIAYRD